MNAMRQQENLARDLFEQKDAKTEIEEQDLAARWIPVALKEVMRNAEDDTATQL